MKRCVLWCLALVVALLSSNAAAHKASDSYLQLGLTGREIKARWQLAVRDLDNVVEVDFDDDRSVTWGELKRARPAIEAYAWERLRLSDGTGACRLAQGTFDSQSLWDGGYAVLEATFECPGAPSVLVISYEAFFEVDAHHRGLASVVQGSRVTPVIFSDGQRSTRLDLLREPSLEDVLSKFASQGVLHIWGGFDHVLFVVSLVLGVAIVELRASRQLVSRSSLRKLAKAISVFTLAHSLTLVLGGAGLLQLPSRWVEASIAGSIVIVAVDNLLGFVQQHHNKVIFAFGLVHGLGFAANLEAMQMPVGPRLLALLSFNLGIEAGQCVLIAVVCVALVLARRFYFGIQRVARAGSLAIAALAMFWLVERLGNFQAFP